MMAVGFRETRANNRLHGLPGAANRSRDRDGSP